LMIRTKCKVIQADPEKLDEILLKKTEEKKEQKESRIVSKIATMVRRVMHL